MSGGIVYRAYSKKEIGSHRITDFVLTKAKEHSVDWIEGADHLGETAGVIHHRDRPAVVIKAHYNDVVRRLRYGQAYFSWQRRLIDLACLRSWRILWRERYSLQYADVLLVPCARILQEMKRQHLSFSRYHAVLPNPVSPVIGGEERQAVVPTLLLAGRIDMGKGIAFLPVMLKKLLLDWPTIQIEIAGPDSYARGLGSLKEWLLRQLGDLANHVVFLGPLNRCQMNEAYERAWVVIVPSQWDTFPTVVLEAMTHGRPIVASPHGGMPEMLEGTENMVADPETDAFSQAVSWFLADAVRRNTAGTSGVNKTATVYHSEPLASKYLETVERLLEQRNSQ
jgi:glycosyltransferase involved in cell wall biosynthesis